MCNMLRGLLNSSSLLSHFIFFCTFYCCSVSRGVSPDFSPFPFLFLFLLPSERPPIGFGGGRRLCGIIMGPSWENCPWKGLSENRREKVGLVSDPSRIHSSGRSCCLEQSHGSPNPLTGWVTLPLPRLFKPRSAGWST